MKKGTKFFVFGGLIGLLVGGMIMIITGCVGGAGMFRTIAARYTFYIHNDHHHKFWSWDEFWSWDDDDGFIDFTEEKEFDISAHDIHSLYVDAGGVELNIEEDESGRSDAIGLVVTRGIGIDTEYRVENGVLTVRSKDEWVPYDGEITIYVPGGMQFESVELNVGAGVADIEGIHTKRLFVNVGAGEVDLEDAVVTEEFTASVGMGQMKYDGAADCNVDLSCGMGQIELGFEGRARYEDFNYDIDCAAGKVEIGQLHFAGLGMEKRIDNHSNKNIRIDCAMGEVEISF